MKWTKILKNFLKKQMNLLKTKRNQEENEMLDLKQGDCLELMKEIPDKSIDMILCDLPYGKTACKWDRVVPFDKLWEQYNRIIKDNGAIVLFAEQPFTSKLVLSNLKLFRQSLVWEKHKASDIFMSKKRILNKHEDILIFYKKLPVYNPQMGDGIPYKKRSSKHINLNGNAIGVSGNIKYSDDLDTSKRYPTSVLKFSNHFQKGNKYHQTQKPVALLEYLIKTYTNEGETVLDNCMGSGSTGVACINTIRNFIGIELMPEYFEVAVQRIEKAIYEHKGV